MFHIEEVESDKYIEVRLTGKLTKEAYDEFVPLAEEQIKERGKVRMLVVMHDFHGWDMAAVWEDTKFGFRHFRDIERLAIVGESQWEKWMTLVCRPFTMAKIKYFDASEVDAARAWMEQDHIPLSHQWIESKRILVLQPSDPLTSSDFEQVAQEVDPIIESGGPLGGLMVEAKSFPGWANLSSMFSHFRFIKNHHHDIKRVALVTDDSVLSHLPSLADHFVAAELKHFDHADKATAMDWLAEAEQAT
ncbi:STAS/SEC14 domain-containing protein [Fuerstiella marisgermanici]|uniref:STAS/SEC14 domain-containing protein n=1 Tax=Fuerstiella marisgermanici TaxID=1891926 RepID=A0A1P8WC04_9PLAN|nr:STAS/SEC14 domain-containing protein [Fuerstiella marisgermanici]APZ91599.1 hypothetical protein Fuma_01188 [Fuerstiella marisgermanici]